MTELMKLNFSPLVRRYERNANFPFEEEGYIRIRAVGFTEKAVDNYVEQLKVNFDLDENSAIEELDQIENITEVNTNQLPDMVNQPSEEDLEITIDCVKSENTKLPCLIHFTIDPGINKETHLYKFKSSIKVILTITASSGAMTAQLLQGIKVVDSKEVDMIGGSPPPKSAKLLKSVSPGQSSEFMVKVTGKMNESSYIHEGSYTIYRV